MSGEIINISDFRKVDDSHVGRSPEEIVVKASGQFIEMMLFILYDSGYELEDDILIDDLLVFTELFTASIRRFEGIEDKNIDILDYCLNRLRKEDKG